MCKNTHRRFRKMATFNGWNQTSGVGVSISETGMKNSERQEFWKEVNKAPALDIVSGVVWGRHCSKNNPQTVEMARSWGRLMQARIEAGDSIRQAASQTYRQIIRYYNLSGIGDMRYLAILRILEHCWRPGGPELRRWHSYEFGV